MREQLCTLLALHAGKTIDQPLAVEMVRQLFPDLSPNPEVFGTREFEGYIFQCERMAAVEVALHSLHAAQYEETEAYRSSIPMQPAYEGFKERERAGGLLQFTARKIDGGELVGHMRVYISTSSHNGVKIATEDTLYLKPEHRGGFTVVRFWQFVEAAVIQIGVREIYFDSKNTNNAGALARYLKYLPIGTKFAKVIPSAQPQAQECPSRTKDSHVLPIRT